MLVTLPFVLLLLDYWPMGRWTKELSAPVKSRRLLWEKVPFIFLSIVLSIVNLWAQNKGGTFAEYLPFPVRVANAIISYVSYLRKIFWPVDLAVFYPYERSFSLGPILVSFFVLIGITIFIVYYFKKLPFLFVGWFWYLGTLIPVIGLVQVGSQAMADRYTYLPSIGIAIMLAWGIPLLFPREDMRKKILFPAGVAILTILAVLTWQQCGYWKNNLELFGHALRVTKNNDLAHNNFGLSLFAEGRIAEAVDHYNQAIRIRPDYVLPYYNRGNAYAILGQYQRAIKDYNESIRLKPDGAEGYYNRGNVYSKLGQYERALEDYNKAIVLKPDYVKTYNNRGIIYGEQGQYPRAIKIFDEIIRLQPDYAYAYYNRGFAYAKLGQYQRAIEDYGKAIVLNPDYIKAYNNRGAAYAKLGQYKLAIADFNEAIRLKPDDEEARQGLRLALEKEQQK
jgi:tetratricopeptide (TPR) repeat protein